MDNNSKSDTLTNFDAVWQRVAGTSSTSDCSLSSHPVDQAAVSAGTAPISDGEARRLLMFIKSEIYLIKTYSILCRHSSGQFKSTVVYLRNASRARLKSLQAAYFLITGNRALPQVNIESFVSIVRTLRSAYIAENSAETAYLSAAKQTDYPSLSEMYTAMSQSARKSGKSIIPLAGKISQQW